MREGKKDLMIGKQNCSFDFQNGRSKKVESSANQQLLILALGKIIEIKEYRKEIYKPYEFG